MESVRGSYWRRWDFHIHTPFSLLNNGYGFDPDKTYEGENPFDEYVKQLFEKAISANIGAIGITDYFSIEGYKRIKQGYLGNPEKMAQLFPDESMREKIRHIFLFPNIEFRIDTFVGKGSNAVNYHVLFSDSVSIADIEECFLRRIELRYSNGNTLPLTKNNIARIGQEYKEHNPNETHSDYLVGLEKITVKYEQVLNILNSSDLFLKKYLISIPVDEDLSEIDWNGRDYHTRRMLYQQCDLLMTSNSKTRLWALAKGREEQQISEFGSIKPCIWGSDAHSYESMFSPTDDRFCWVKADTTFEGLQQIRFEPEDRVRIQKEKPEEKSDHQIIDYIQFDDEKFQTEPIFLSEGLTTIIGGKSTGKSILLRHIALGTDPNQVQEREKKAVGSGRFSTIPAKVVWRDGASGERKIIYIPQSWLNRIVDEKGGESQLNQMLQTILLQQEEIHLADAHLKRRISEITEALKHNILDYIAAHESVKECELSLHDHGRSEAFQASIEKLEQQRDELSAEAGITEEMLLRYSEIGKRIEEQSNILEVIKAEEPQLDFQSTPFVYLPGITSIDTNGNPKYDLAKILTVSREMDEAIQKMNEAILAIWEPSLQKAIQLLAEKKRVITRSLEENQQSILPLQQAVSKSEQLQKIDIKLKEERGKKRQAVATEAAKAESIERANELKQTILASRERLLAEYITYATVVSSANTPDSDLEFEADVDIKKQALFEAISALFDNRNLRTFKEKYNYNVLDSEDLIIDDGLFIALWDAMIKGILSFKGGNSLNTALERLFSDWFYIHYSVKSGDDLINNMSPGKKALVLLEMIVNLEKSNCPILIDQPEDDLDNRSIYRDLVTYLKAKKHDRQIVVVTHNANVVVGADAEEVIIANQRGKESPNRYKRFEYRSGSIENSNPVYGADGVLLPGILNQKGIQEQICDILEGGKDAFELRRKKYIKA